MAIIIYVMTAEAVLEKLTIIYNVSLFKIVFSDSYTGTISILPFCLSVSVRNEDFNDAQGHKV